MDGRWTWLLGLLAVSCVEEDDGMSVMDGSLDAGMFGPQVDLDAQVRPDVVLPWDADVCRRREEHQSVISANRVDGGVVYPDPPPVGGDYSECWAKWGVYGEELAVERWVHNLRQGGVVFLYNCPGGCDEEVDSMRVYASGRTQALLSPYAAMPTRFAAVAWGVRLLTDCLDMPAFQDFYQRRVDRAPLSSADDPPRSCD